jgi:uracil-DNA glycosylase
MFIGEGPGKLEESVGEPLVGPSGKLLKMILKGLNFTDSYFTNLVTCRSCEPVMDQETGLPRMIKRKRGHDEVMMQDQPPLPSQIEACSRRLHEEIYIVDPILIVSVGGTATEALFGKPIAITKEHGQPKECIIPGATLRPVLTDKKQIWGHKIRGEYQMPTEQNEVRYLVMPILHPAFVLRKGADLGKKSPLRLLTTDLRLAVKIYERYLVEALGVEPTSTSDADLTEVEEDNGFEHEDSP